MGRKRKPAPLDAPLKERQRKEMELKKKKLQEKLRTKKKEGEGAVAVAAPAADAPKSVAEVNDLFMAGGDIKSIGRDARGPFTAAALEARYKEEGVTVTTDKSFSFKDLYAEKTTWTLTGGAGPTGGSSGGGLVASSSERNKKGGVRKKTSSSRRRMKKPPPPSEDDDSSSDSDASSSSSSSDSSDSSSSDSSSSDSDSDDDDDEEEEEERREDAATAEKKTKAETTKTKTKKPEEPETAEEGAKAKDAYIDMIERDLPNFFVPGQGDAKGAKKDQAGGGGRAAMTEEELNAECIEYLIRSLPARMEEAKRLAPERAKRAQELNLEFGGPDGGADVMALMGITPEIVEEAKSFVNPYKNDEEMLKDWYPKRDAWREDYKKKRRAAMRRKKGFNPGGSDTLADVLLKNSPLDRL